MTLIARLSVNRAPFLLGDVLLSTTEKAGRRVHLPLVGDINAIVATRKLPFEISRFAQKVNLFGNRLAVAWAGSAVQAIPILRKFSDISSRANFAFGDLQAAFEGADKKPIDNFALIGLLVNDVKGKVVEAKSFAFRVDPVEVDRIGEVHVAGSGRTAFLKVLTRVDWTSKGNEFQVAYGLLGDLIGEEYRTGETIANRWGGGFEAAVFSVDERRFVKIGNILHTFWKLKYGTTDSVDFLPMFYKTTYWRDALIIRSARFDEIAPRSFRLAANDTDLVPPMLKNHADYDLTELGSVDFSYKVHCCHVLIEKPNGRDIMLLVESHDANREVALEISASSGRLHISAGISRAILTEYAKQAASPPTSR
jgi:hypothetical protein